MRFKVAAVIFSFLLSQIQAGNVNDYAIIQNCTETYSISTPKYVPYDEPYRTRTWLGTYKWKTRTNYRLENHMSFQKRPTCCSGYINYGANMCMPVCSRPCGPHGVCAQPEYCKCDDGYTMDYGLNECKPICREDCIHGVCSAPDTCTCNDGYRLLPDEHTCAPVCAHCDNLEFCVEPHICRCINGYTRESLERLDRGKPSPCRPVCDRDCVNADCVEPNLCKCRDGYFDEDNDVFTCEPVCSRGCRDGVCSAPETCSCFAGYELRPNSTHICEPQCSVECVNADCIAPGICSCREGYVPSVGGDESHVCEPYCTSPCTHGRCSQPETCDCDAGYEPVNNSTACEPRCDEPCVDGSCTGPNTCTCFEGYKPTEDGNSTCEPICNEPCVNGRCTAPDECTCLEGYEMKNSTTGPSRCVVVCECENGNCIESDSVCESCAEGYELVLEGNRTRCEPQCGSDCGGGRCVEPQKCECYDNYLAANDTRGNPTCVHACGGECVHGSCDAENATCACAYGWSGKYCDVPSLCRVSVTHNQTIYLQLNETAYEFESGAADAEPWLGPSCHDRCTLQVDNTTQCHNQSDAPASELECFMDIESPCNIYSVVRSDHYKTELGTVTVVISTVIPALLLVIVVPVLLFIIKKRRRMKSIELTKSINRVPRSEEDCLMENDTASTVSL